MGALVDILLLMAWGAIIALSVEHHWWINLSFCVISLFTIQRVWDDLN